MSPETITRSLLEQGVEVGKHSEPLLRAFFAEMAYRDFGPAQTANAFHFFCSGYVAGILRSAMWR